MQILKWLSSSWFLLLMWNFGAGSRAGSIVCNRSAKVVSILFLNFFFWNFYFTGLADENLERDAN